MFVLVTTVAASLIGVGIASTLRPGDLLRGGVPLTDLHLRVTLNGDVALIKAIMNPSSSQPYVFGVDANGHFRYNLEGTWLQKYNERNATRLVDGKNVYDLGVFPSWRANCIDRSLYSMG